MKKEFPFMDLRVKHVAFNPDPDVPYLDTDESTGNEVVKKLPASIWYQQFPLVKDEVKLQDYLNAGIPLKEVPTRLYESLDSCDYPFTQDDLYNKAQEIIDSYEPINKEEE